MNKPGPTFTGPRPSKKTRYRVIGPLEINGMNVWRVHEILGVRNGKTVLSASIGPDCFSPGAASDRCKDLVKGKKMIFFGNTTMVPRKIY